MRGLVTLLTISGLVLAGCAGFRGSSADPANGSGSGQAATAGAPAANPLLPEEGESIFRRKSDAEIYAGTAIHAVQDVTVEPASGGAIVKATGVSLRQGAFDVRLWPENGGVPVEGMLTYTLRAVQRADTPQGPEQTRRVSAGQFVSSQTLAAARGVRVLSQTTTATSTR
jgi:hypothetical protein